MVHPFADKWRGKKRNPYFALVPAWICLWILAGVATSAWRGIHLYRSGLAWLPALLLFAAGIRVYFLSSKDFSSSQLGGLHEVRPGQNQQLVTTGIRTRVRHPVYLGHLCEMFGWTAGSGLTVCLGLTLFAIITGWVMIGMEDAELEKRFGENYRKYRREVPALLPK